MVHHEEHWKRAVVPVFEVALANRCGKRQAMVFLDVARTRLGLHLDDAATGLESVAVVFWRNDFNLAVDSNIVLRDDSKEAVHLVRDDRDSIQPTQFRELRNWHSFRHRCFAPSQKTRPST